MRIDAALREAAARLQPVAGSGRLDALLLLEHVTGARREAFLRDGERPLAEAERAALAALVERRRAGVPIAYLTGNVGFHGRTFAVDPHVLVPRPETEVVVEAALAALRAGDKAAGRIADVGTGSGALAVTLAAELPSAAVFASDLSPLALAVARRNAEAHDVAARCTFRCGDLGAPLRADAPFDALVANLPYVPTAQIPGPPDPVAFEPRLALDGGPDGLAAYRRLLAELNGLLADDALVVLEAAPPTIAALAAAVAETFPRAQVEIGADYAGLARFVLAWAQALPSRVPKRSTPTWRSSSSSPAAS